MFSRSTPPALGNLCSREQTRVSLAGAGRVSAGGGWMGRYQGRNVARVVLQQLRVHRVRPAMLLRPRLHAAFTSVLPVVALHALSVLLLLKLRPVVLLLKLLAFMPLHVVVLLLAFTLLLVVVVLLLVVVVLLLLVVDVDVDAVVLLAQVPFPFSPGRSAYGDGVPAPPVARCRCARCEGGGVRGEGGAVHASRCSSARKTKKAYSVDSGVEDEEGEEEGAGEEGEEEGEEGGEGGRA